MIDTHRPVLHKRTRRAGSYPKAVDVDTYILTQSPQTYSYVNIKSIVLTDSLSRLLELSLSSFFRLRRLDDFLTEGARFFLEVLDTYVK